MALTAHFEEQSGIEGKTLEDAGFVLAAGQNPAIDDNPYDLDTAAERDMHYDTLLEDVSNLQNGDVEVAYDLQSSVQNDDTWAERMESASVTGGELGLQKNWEMGVDEAFQARRGDRSFNLSDINQEKHHEKWGDPTEQEEQDAASDANNEEIASSSDQWIDTTEQWAEDEHYILETPDLTVSGVDQVIATVVEHLEIAGVSHDDIKAAMGAGGSDNAHETLLALQELAEDVPEVKAMFDNEINQVFDLPDLERVAQAAMEFNPRPLSNEHDYGNPQYRGPMAMGA